MVVKLNEDIVYRVKGLPAIHRAYPLVVWVDTISLGYLWEFVSNAAEKEKFLSYAKKEIPAGVMYELHSYSSMQKIISQAKSSRRGEKFLEVVINCFSDILEQYGELI